MQNWMMENSLEVLELSPTTPANPYAAQLSTLQEDVASHSARVGGNPAQTPANALDMENTSLLESLERQALFFPDASLAARGPAIPHAPEINRYNSVNAAMSSLVPGRGAFRPAEDSMSTASSILGVEAVADAASTGNLGLNGRRGLSLPRGVKRKRLVEAGGRNSLELEDGQRCSICLDPWTSQGKHRICTLLCGHLFGQSCIERWLKEKRSCPQCGARVGSRNTVRIIPLFVNALVAAQDTGELETTRKLLEEERRLRKQCEVEKVRLSIQNESLKDQLYRIAPRYSTEHLHARSAKMIASPTMSATSGAAFPAPVPPAALARGGLDNIVGNPKAIISKAQGLTSPVACPRTGSRANSYGVPPACAVGTGGSLGCEVLQAFSLDRPPVSASSGFVVPRSCSPTSRGIGCDPCYPAQNRLLASHGDGQHAPPPWRAARASSSIAGWTAGCPIEDGGGTGRGAVGGRGAWSVGDWGHGEGRRGSIFDVGTGEGERGSGMASSSLSSSSLSSGAKGGHVRYEALLAKELRSGRVVTFAGGDACALLVSQEFPGANFSSRGATMGHGITKFSLLDVRHNKRIPVHRGQVRDVKFKGDEHGSPGYMLTTAFDKTLKVCDLRTDSVVIEYRLDGDGWSCQWSATDTNMMFGGIVDGSRYAAVQLFDLRSTAGAVRNLRAAGGQHQPVHSICHTPADELVCATVCGVWGWAGGTKSDGRGWASGTYLGSTGDEGAPAEQLQIQAGACCSLSCFPEPSTCTPGASPARFLVSTRGASASHAVYTLGSTSSPRGFPSRVATEGEQQLLQQGVPAGAAAQMGNGSCTEERSGVVAPGPEVGYLTDGKAARRTSWAQLWRRWPAVAKGHQSQNTLSRSLLWEPAPGAGLLLAGGDERTNQPWIWDATTGEVHDQLPANKGPVLDVASFQEPFSNRGLFAAVSQGDVRLYRTFVAC